MEHHLKLYLSAEVMGCARDGCAQFGHVLDAKKAVLPRLALAVFSGLDAPRSKSRLMPSTVATSLVV